MGQSSHHSLNNLYYKHLQTIFWSDQSIRKPGRNLTQLTNTSSMYCSRIGSIFPVAGRKKHTILVLVTLWQFNSLLSKTTIFGICERGKSSN